MMKRILSLVLTAALCVPALAQRSPKIDQTITSGDAKMSLNYTAVSYGEGKTVAAMLAKDGAETRKMVNERLASRPIATFSTTIDVTCGDVTLPAGEYQLYPTLGDDLVWSLNFKAGDKVTTTKLKVADSEHDSKRLLMCLYAEETGAGVYLAFGKMSSMVSFTPAKKEGK